MSASTSHATREPWPARWILLAALLGLALRVVYVLQSRASPLFDAPQMDALYHAQWAQAFARGEDFQPGPFFRAPLYPWFLGACWKLFGDGWLAPRLVQALLGAVSVLLTGRIAWRVFDRRVAIAAAFGAATYWMLIYFEGELLLPVLEVFFDLLAIELTLAASERARDGGRHALRWASAGACFGVAALVRPNILLFAAPIAAWCAWGTRDAWRAPRFAWTKLAPACAFVLGLALPISPIAAYNRFVGHDAVLISSQGGVNLFIGNNPASDGSSAIVPGTRPDWWGGYRDAIALAERAEGRALRPSEVSSHYTRAALAWMRDEPRAALEHLLWKTRLFWTDYELGNNQDESFFALRYGPVLRVLPLTFGLVAPLGLLGLALTLRRGWRAFPAWGFVPVYSASVIAFFVCARFRIPILPLLIVFAASSVFWMLDALRARRWRPLGFALATAGLLAWWSASVPASVDRSHAQGWYLLGVDAGQRRDWSAAVEHFEKARDANPRLSIVHQALGLALLELGRFEQGEAELREAVRIDARTAFESFSALVERAIAAGRFDEARAYADRELELRPDSGAGAYDAGRVAFARAQALRASGGDAQALRAALDEARSQFARALSLRLDAELAFNAPYSAGRVALERGDATAAAELLERAARAGASAPQPEWLADALRGLARALIALGRASEVRTRLEPLARTLPEPMRASLAKELFGE